MQTKGPRTRKTRLALVIIYTVNQHRAKLVSRFVVRPMPFRQPIYKCAITVAAVDSEEIEFQSGDKVKLARLPKEMGK